MLVLFAALNSFSVNLYAQNNTLPFYYQFLAISAEYCGAGTLRFFGYSYGYQSPSQWSIHGTLPYYNDPGGFLTYSWTLQDEAGTLASGSYDSITGATTGGTYGSSFGFTTQRFPIGQLSFRANGTVRGRGSSGSLCTQSFDATTYTAISGGGYFTLKTNTSYNYKFTNSQSNLVLQVADSFDYTPATQGINGTGNQSWRLSTAAGEGRYDFINNATGKPLYSDFSSGSPLVFQLFGSSRGWRFVSVGDGTSFYIVYEYNNRIGDPQYAMEPTGGSVQVGAVIEALSRANRQSQKWIVTTE